VNAASPSTVARQQRFQEEELLCTMGLSQFLKTDKKALFFPIMEDPSKPAGEKHMMTEIMSETHM